MTTKMVVINKSDLNVAEAIEPQIIMKIQEILVNNGYPEPVMYPDRLIIMESDDKLKYYTSCAFSISPHDWVSLAYAVPPENFVLDIRIDGVVSISDITYKKSPVSNYFGFFDISNGEYFNVTHFKVKYKSITT